MIKSKPRKKVSKRSNPCPPFICGFNPSTKKTRFKRNPDINDEELYERRQIMHEIATIKELVQLKYLDRLGINELVKIRHYIQDARVLIDKTY